MMDSERTSTSFPMSMLSSGVPILVIKAGDQIHVESFGMCPPPLPPHPRYVTSVCSSWNYYFYIIYLKDEYILRSTPYSGQYWAAELASGHRMCVL